MKSVIFIVLFIGVGSVKADLVGTLNGAVDLVPYLTGAAIATNKAADAKKALAKAFDKTLNCGLSGSNQDVLNVAQSTDHLAEVFADVTTAVKNYIDNNGQLMLLTGDLSQVTDEYKNTADAMIALSNDICALTEIIDTENFDGVDKAIASIEKLTKSTSDFNQVFVSVNPLPSRTILKTGSLISGFTDSVHNFAVASNVESVAILAAEQRCNVLTGLSKALSDYAQMANTLYGNLQL